MTRTTIALWLAIISLLGALPAVSQEDFELSRSFFVDVNRTATIADAMDADFVPHAGSIAQGYSSLHFGCG